MSLNSKFSFDIKLKLLKVQFKTKIKTKVKAIVK